MLRSRIQSLIWFFIIFLLYIYSDSYFVLFLLIISIGIFLFLGISTKLIENKVEFILKTPDTIDKNTSGTCYLESNNTTFLPISKVKCILSLKNLLTGEEERQEIYFSIKGKDQEHVYWDMKSEFCGNIKIRLEKVIFYDYFGIFANTNYSEVSTNMLVLPDTFYIGIDLLQSEIENRESAVYSTAQKGLDNSEVFDIKEYIPGDNLKNIHWKLTSKFDELIVKELSVPIDNSILVLLETSIPIGEVRELPEVSDAMMEAFVSVSRSLLENQYIHSVGWFDHKVENLLIDEVNSMDDLSSLLRGLLEIEKKENQYSVMDYYFNIEADSTFSHIVYITSQESEEIAQELSNRSQITVLQCQALSNEEEIIASTSGVIFNPENMKEDLRQLMI